MGNGERFFPSAGNPRTNEGINDTRVFGFPDKQFSICVKGGRIEVIVGVD